MIMIAIIMIKTNGGNFPAAAAVAAVTCRACAQPLRPHPPHPTIFPGRTTTICIYN